MDLLWYVTLQIIQCNSFASLRKILFSQAARNEANPFVFDYKLFTSLLIRGCKNVTDGLISRRDDFISC